MRDVECRLAAFESRRAQQGPWDFANLTDDELEFVQSFRGVKDIAEVPLDDLARLAWILLSAGRIEGSASALLYHRARSAWSSAFLKASLDHRRLDHSSIGTADRFAVLPALLNHCFCRLAHDL
ncbi:hypothetical protein [Sphingomonas sp. BAUL-RG-20F-R05-02]|jgi:hypothetical protein|uniref:hypothetical protein n=1 Tax=Sphingomonas sp. BAUL-RG-20F-R05-02 TaxID=2914830 RepID=UPI001F59FD47|nr:hypothetical protein [Sphingomonas sp. BAUL-RG-20F-R05-02]